MLPELPEGPLQAIRAIALTDGEDWGMVDAGASGQVDPYLFTLAAVQAVAWVTNGVLERLQWERYADDLPEDIREERRGWFKGDVGLAHMNRLFSDSAIPPYF